MRADLRPHPSSPGSPAVAIKGAASRTGPAVLSVAFRLTGDVAALRIPPAGPGNRADELWRRTCFETFVKPVKGETYFEFNFSPSGQWAAYRFNAYRQGMAEADTSVAIQARLHDGGLDLLATVALATLPELTGDWRLGLTAVLEATDGSLSYWSVAHPPGQPDFHHADCFALEVPAPQDP